MNFSGSHIAYGPRAGMPQHSADILQDKNTEIRAALAVLKRNGFEPVHARIGISGFPSIEVAAGSATQRLIDEGSAVEYMVAPDRRRWQARLDRVVVFWNAGEGS